MNRRDLIKGGIAATGVLALSGVQQACTPKNLSSWVASIVGGFTEIKPLLPQLGLSQAVIDRVSGFIDKAVLIAHDFDAAYKAGKFTTAATLFGSLSDLITQIAGELNVTSNRIVKLALVSIAIARIAIASLLSQQAPSGLTAANPAEQKAATEIRRLAAVDVNQLAKALPL